LIYVQLKANVDNEHQEEVVCLLISSFSLSRRFFLSLQSCSHCGDFFLFLSLFYFLFEIFLSTEQAKPKEEETKQAEKKEEKSEAPKEEEKKEEEKKNEGESGATTPSPTTGGGESGTSANLQSAESQFVQGSEQVNAMISQISGMGFPEDQVLLALRASFFNPDRAVEYLLQVSNVLPSSFFFLFRTYQTLFIYLSMILMKMI